MPFAAIWMYLEIVILSEVSLAEKERYPEEMKSLCQKGICTRMFIAALFPVVKTWKQPKCPLIDEWIKKMWYIDTQWNITQP